MGQEARGYRPIRDYAIVGDDQTVALVARDGSIDWFCLPRFDSAPVCCRLLDAERGGFFHIRPAAGFDAERSYLGLTNLLATTFCTDSGRVRLIDCMPMSTSIADPKRPRLLRYVEGLAGIVELVVELRPVFNYGRTSAIVALRRDGALAYTGQEWVWLAGLRHVVRSDAGNILARMQVRGGDRRCIMLAYGSGSPTEPAAEMSAAEAALARTRTYWERWAATCTYEGRHRPLVQRSALTLKLLTFEPTGALVAAPTTSLPETVGGVRNWDDRYTGLSWAGPGVLAVGGRAPAGTSGRAARAVSDRWRPTPGGGAHLDPGGIPAVPTRAAVYFTALAARQPASVLEPRRATSLPPT